MSYTVRFKEPKSMTWETVKGVVSDDVMVIGGTPLLVRVLITEEKVRMEIPMSLCVIEFSRERALEIEKEKDKNVSG